MKNTSYLSLITPNAEEILALDPMRMKDHTLNLYSCSFRGSCFGHQVWQNSIFQQSCRYFGRSVVNFISLAKSILSNYELK
jgi:hypothetical protein